MSSIIWHNDDWTVFVIDGPGSITAAQVMKGQPVIYRIVSQMARAKLWDPVKADDDWRWSTKMQKHHTEIISIITDALEEISNALKTQPWCNERVTTHYKISTKLLQEIVDGHLVVKEIETQNLVSTATATNPVANHQPAGANDTQAQGQNAGPEDQSNADLVGNVHDGNLATPQPIKSALKPTNFYHNHRDYPIKILVRPEDSKIRSRPFWIPPHAAFLLSDCHDAHLLKQSVQFMHDKHNHPDQFDLILMDPPWPNSSAEDKGGYKTFPMVEDMNVMWLHMNLSSYMATGCIVAVWITNREMVRNQVLGPGGLFDRWGVDLIEEWIWIKTTPNGVPLCPLDTEKRKPWETLLVGQKSHNVPSTGNKPVQRRVIAGAPDLHSRKPCLKEVFELFMRKKEGEYMALEIFARACVSGWWSWGDEAIKFNWENFWQKAKENTDQEEKQDEEKQDEEKQGEEKQGEEKQDEEEQGEEEQGEEEQFTSKSGQKRKAVCLE
ncbi:MT-A70-domain-containing protein [Botryosphaeria dothidea]|uniref:MT-A70-domain-containing protein n=1 Tax=Botryosphaeria dothidea TaxID=55169 RepID=A0A8H4N0T3_9PEZI|nr:MT-A70-domain-containing protein [Botryosphaeria dothidea]